MKKAVVSCLVAFGLSFFSNVQANDVEALAKSKNCLSCHAVEIGRAHVRTPVTEKSRMPSSA